MLKIGNLTPDNPYIVAPMAGYTDVAFRRVMTEHGAGFAVTEMVSAKALVFDNQKTKLMLRTAESEKIKSVQLFGRDPEDFKRVLKSGDVDEFDIVDLNFGCPVGKIIRNGEGSALLKEPALLLKIVETCANNFPVVTVKLRAGFDEQSILPSAFFKDLERAGAKLITMHGRTAEQMYRGISNWDYVKRVKDAVSVAVAGSGDILTVEEAQNALKIADFVMIGRGAMYDPTLFDALNGKNTQRFEVIFRHLDYLSEYFDDKYASTTVRKFWGYYLKGLRDTHKLKVELMQTENVAKIKSLLSDFILSA